MYTLKHKRNILDNPNFPSINAGLFLFYLAILGNYTGDLISPSLSKLINNNRLAQHAIAFFILLFTINLYSDLHVHNVLLCTILLWIWFLFTSKQQLIPSIAIIGLLVISYAFYLLTKKLETNIKISEYDKLVKKKRYVRIQNICFILIIIVSSIGGYLYFIEHYKQYRGQSKTFMAFLFKYLLRGKGTSK